MKEILRKLKDYYSLSDSEFEERIAVPSVSDLPNPFILYSDFHLLIDKLKEYIKENKKIVVYGDYDVDGLTSTSILVGTLQIMGVTPGYYIPSRYIDGYGINKTRVDQFIAKGYEVIITVDNGISEVETIDYAKSKGLEVIVIDHHEVTKDVLPNADFIFHQYICNISNYNISAAFLALMVSYGILGEYNEYFITLAGLAVFSDSMPVIHANLTLARLSLYYVNKYKYLQFTSLLNVVPTEITEEDYNYQVIPALNSVGRVDKTIWINNIVKYFLSSDKAYIQNTALKILSFNLERKEIIKKFDIASIKFTGNIAFDYVSLPLGVVGLLANKTMSSYNKPAVLFTEDPSDNNLLVGSIRTPQGYKTSDVLSKECKFLVRYGGHDEAAGFTIDKKDIDLLKKTLDEMLVKVDEDETDEKYILLSAKDAQLHYDAIKQFGPYGISFPSPLIGVEIEDDKLAFSRSGEHMLSNFDGLKVTYFNHTKDEFKSKSYIFIGKLGTSVFKGITSIELKVSDFIDKNKISLD